LIETCTSMLLARLSVSSAARAPPGPCIQLSLETVAAARADARSYAARAWAAPAGPASLMEISRKLFL
jgi:hypothetical protein